MPLVSEQVKILLERMDLHPEEFVRPFESRRLSLKWDEVISEGYFNRVEKFLIRRKYNALRRKATQELIMATILYEPNAEEEPSFDTVSRATRLLMNAPRMRLKQTKI